MNHFIRYDSRTGNITGHVFSMEDDVDPLPRSDAEQVLKITSEAEIEQLRNFNPFSSRITGRVRGGDLHALKVEPLFKGRILLTSENRDHDGDGMPEAAADGASVVRVKATIQGPDGKPVGANVPVAFSVTRGTLTNRKVDARNGFAEVEWRSPAETVQARIVAQAEGFRQASLTLEFIPPDEYRALSSSGKK